MMYFRLSQLGFSPSSLSTLSSVTTLSKNSIVFCIADSGISFATSSFFTPSVPILSSLSSVTQTVSKFSPAKPNFSSSALRICLSFILIEKFWSPRFFSVFAIVKIRSISQILSSLPRMSMSH